MEQADLAQRCLHSCQINPGMRLKRNSEEVPLNLESWALEMFLRLSMFLIQWHHWAHGKLCWEGMSLHIGE